MAILGFQINLEPLGSHSTRSGTSTAIKPAIDTIT